MDEIRAINKTKHYDILAFTESWLDLKEQHYPAEIAMRNYTTFNTDKPNNKRGGGLCLYIKQTLLPIQKHSIATEHFQILHINITATNNTNYTHTVKIILAYRRPQIPAQDDEQFFQHLENLLDSPHESIIIGDFNAPHLNWTDIHNNPQGNRLIRFVYTNNLTQQVHSPTRGDNILDLILTSDPDLTDSIKVGHKLGDHNIINFEITLNHTTNLPSKEVFNFRRANFEEMREDILNFLERNLLGEVFPTRTTQELFNDIKTIIHTSSDRHIPKKRLQSNDPSWCHEGIKELINIRERAHSAMTNSRTVENMEAFHNSARNVKRAVKEAKRTNEESIARQSKSNPKAFYAHVNKTRIHKPRIGPLTDNNGEPVTQGTEMAQTMNEYFASVFTAENLDNIPQIVNKQYDRPLNTVYFPPQEVQELLLHLNIYKSMGPDQLHPRILRELGAEISEYMANLFTKSMATGDIPEEWRTANVVAIHKKGSRQKPENYRPISLTSIPCKTMERVIKKRITTHLERNNLINPSQHGFRDRRGCLTNLLDFYNDVIELDDTEQAVDVIYFDFKKAFDKVPHQRLINQLEVHGITGDLLRWLTNWLTTRQQRVVIDNDASDWKRVTSGVPQGSVLGPLLFIIYINDIDTGISSKISKFADDTKICHRAKTEADQDVIQEDIDKLLEWSRKSQMEFHEDKCTLLHVGIRNSKFNYTIGEQQLTTVQEQRDLGVTVTENLKWNKHIDKSVKKANAVAGLIARNFQSKSEDIILTLHKSLVRPLLEYAGPVHSPHAIMHKNKIERVQKRMTKMIPTLRQKSYPERLNHLKLIPLEQRRTRGQLIETFKYLKGITRADPTPLFTLDNNTRTRNNGMKLMRRRANSTAARCFFPTSIVQTWNDLPREVVESDTTNTFKNRLDKHWERHPPRMTYTV